MIEEVDSSVQIQINNEVITNHSTQNNELNNINQSNASDIGNDVFTSHVTHNYCDSSLSTYSIPEANENVPGTSNRIRAVISSKEYIGYLKNKEKKKVDIENQKKEKRKNRLDKALKNFEKMSQNLNKLKNQVQEDDQN